MLELISTAQILHTIQKIFIVIVIADWIKNLEILSKSLQKETSVYMVYATIWATSSPKINSKTSKINAVLKVAVGLRKQGTLRAKSYNPYKYIENSD